MMTEANKPKKRVGQAPSDLLRWTLQRAGTEFGADRTQLERRRRALSIEPGDDGFYSSAQIAQMLFGDKEAEQIGKLAAERRNMELKNAMLEATIVPTADVCSLFESMFIVIRQKICTSKLSDNERKELLEDLVSMGQRDWIAEITIK